MLCCSEQSFLDSTALLGRFVNIIVKTRGGGVCIVSGNHWAAFSSHVSWTLNHELWYRAVFFQGKQSGESST